MSTVVMVGVSHRTATLPLLERVAVPADRRAGVLAAVRAVGYSGAVLLATCSRTEIYASGEADASRLVDVLAGAEGAAAASVRRAVVLRTGEGVASHLFRVTAGLESRIVGEPEIRSQVRAAWRDACDAGAAGGVLGELFAAAVRAADRVHKETSLGSATRSLASRAVHIGLTHTASQPSVLVVGSGRMASAAVRQLGLLGHRPVVVARDMRGAVRLAGASRARPLAELTTLMATADLVICTTSAYEPLVKPDDVRRAMLGRMAPLTLVDLSVPRNVDPAVAGVHGVRVVDLEAMHDHPGTDPALTGSVVQAEALVRTAVQRHCDHLAARRAGPLIAAMRARVESRCLEVIHASAPSTCSEEEQVRMAHTIAGRLLHPATIAARTAAAAGDDAALLTICDAFDITLTPETLGLSADCLLAMSVRQFAANANTGRRFVS